MKCLKIWLTVCGFMSQAFSEEIKAQESADVENVFKVNVVSPGISYETPIGKKQTIYIEAYLSPYFSFSYSSNFGSSTDFGAIPSFDVAYRYYYNGKKRAEEGLTTSLNNMNYFTFVYNAGIYKETIPGYYEDETKLRVQHVIGIAWGFQRNYNNRISIDVNVGPGCAISSSSDINPAGQSYSKLNIEPALVLKARFGFWLNKRK
ncbi:MAG: DUF3575 domain-containing protein [Chitinophagaceae bacterium]|nr:DUF3575 domain-containing protein [Chitinophagaceae bacterium]